MISEEGTLSQRTRENCALSDCRTYSWCPYELVHGCPPYFPIGSEIAIETKVISKDEDLTLVEFVLDGVKHKEWQVRQWPWLCCPFRPLEEEGF